MVIFGARTFHNNNDTINGFYATGPTVFSVAYLGLAWSGFVAASGGRVEKVNYGSDERTSRPLNG